jgi:undecaprenyl-diphosphatase
MDRAIFHWINGWSSSYEQSMKFFSEALNYGWMKAILAVVLIAMIAAGKDTRKAALTSLIAFPIANGLTDLFKNFLPLPRPCNDPTIDQIVVRIGTTLSPGTASAHSANMLAVAICMTLSLRWGGIPWILLALMVSLSRIYNGVHYPYQVLLGWLCGAFAAILVNVIWNLVAKKRALKKESYVATAEETTSN